MPHATPTPAFGFEDLLGAQPDETDRQYRKRLAALLPFAQDPTTDSKRLSLIFSASNQWRQNQQSARPEQRALWEALAAHPNISLGELKYLVRRAAKSLCRNPIAPLIALEDPSWVMQLRLDDMLSLVRCAEAPLALLNQIAALEVDHLAAARAEARLHVGIAGKTSGETWRGELLQYWQQHVKELEPLRRARYAEFVLIGLLPDWVIGDSLESKAAMTTARERLARAADPMISEAERSMLQLEDPFIMIRVAALLNPSIPLEDRQRMIRRSRQEGYQEGFDYLLGARVDQRTAFHTASEVLDECRRTLLFASTKRGRYFYEYLLPLPVFAGAIVQPEKIKDPVEEQRNGDGWQRLLGWALGVRPRPEGGWDAKADAGLRALAEDGNRFIQFVARARLKDPGITFSW